MIAPTVIVSVDGVDKSLDLTGLDPNAMTAEQFNERLAGAGVDTEQVRAMTAADHVEAEVRRVAAAKAVQEAAAAYEARQKLVRGLLAGLEETMAENAHLDADVAVHVGLTRESMTLVRDGLRELLFEVDYSDD